MSSTNANVEVDSATDASNICIDCGMCCDGTLFSEVSVRPYDDFEMLTTKGLTIRPQGEELVFGLPCTEFTGGRCAIYDCRPAVCRSYRCQLMRRVDQNEIGATEARELIVEVLVFRDRVRDSLHEAVAPDSPTPIGEMRRRLRELIGAPAGSDGPVLDHAALMHEADTLGLLLSRHFLDDDVAVHATSDRPAPIGHLRASSSARDVGADRHS